MPAMTLDQWIKKVGIQNVRCRNHGMSRAANRLDRHVRSGTPYGYENFCEASCRYPQAEGCHLVAVQEINGREE